MPNVPYNTLCHSIPFTIMPLQTPATVSYLRYLSKWIEVK